MLRYYMYLYSMKTKALTPLNGLIVSLALEEYNALLEEQKQLREQVELLSAELELYKRHLWGASAEKRQLPEDPSLLDICFDSALDTQEKEVKEVLHKAKEEEKNYNRFRKKLRSTKHGHARKPIDPKYPREEIVIEPNEDLTGAVLLGEEVSEQWAIKIQHLYVRRTVRKRYKLADGRIVIAPLPVQAYPKSNASESVLSHIAVAKYADHLPLNRQIEIFSREGVHLSASTISNWMAAAAQRIEPIYNELREKVRSTYYIQADETPHKVLESEKKGSLHKGYMWNFYLPQQKTPFFVYSKGRGRENTNILLDCGVKVVQSDGYGVYDVFDSLPGYLHLCCWAHVRRKFIEAEGYDLQRATYALDKIGQLYGIEKEIAEKSLDADAAVSLRRKQAYPIICKLEEWAADNRALVLKSSPISKAIEYMYSRMEQLSGYINDAQLQIDNNNVERSIRPLTLNRKNTLFSGSHDAAYNAAIFFSLLGACKEHEVNPQQWLNDALIKVEQCPIDDYSSLLPWNWKKQNNN